MDNRKRITVAFAAAAAVMTLGCGVEKPELGAPAAQSGLRMTIGPTTGATEIRFLINAVDCKTGAFVRTAVDRTRPLDELTIPDDIPELADHPLDAASAHAFADHFEVLPPGCYDVSTQPFDGKDPVCHEARQNGVLVDAGKTTEIFLVNQCDGTPVGALDVISALNHPPVLLGVDFQDSKFVQTCGDQVVCARASDVEHDPLKFVWTITGGPAAGPVQTESETLDDGSILQCALFIASAPGRISLTVDVYDLLHDNASKGEPETFEQWFADHGYPTPSHTSLDFFYYAETGPAAPVPEICDDGVDNDCDGLLDNQDPDCAPGCPPGVQRTCDVPLDFMWIQDRTGSFADNRSTVNSFTAALASDLLAANADTMFGVASFKDKPIIPLGTPTDFIYRLEHALTGTPQDFVSTIAGLVAIGGGDDLEGQLEALNLMVQDAALGFRSSPPRVVVLATDSPPHVAPQCVKAGLCTVPNNNDGVADANEDYPSRDQLQATLNARGVTPVFVVGAGNESFYQPIVNGLGRGRVVTLSKDVTALENAIFAGLPCRCAVKSP